jgi:hypothetical protein
MEEAIMMKARPTREITSQPKRTSIKFRDPIQKLTIVQLLPPSLQTPKLLLALLIRIVRLQSTSVARHGLVHGNHNAKCPGGSRKVKSKRCAEPRQLGCGSLGLVAVEVRGDGQDEVGDGAGTVERREEFLGVVQQVGGHCAGVVRGDVAELQHGHDQWGLQDGAAWVVGLDLLRLSEWLVGSGDTEVDGCADYCEGLCDVS